MITKNFEQWLTEEVENTFGLENVPEELHQGLQNWLSDTQLNLELVAPISKLQKTLKENVNIWNEEELKMMFISPILTELDFNNRPHYKVFAQRKVQLKTDIVDSSGKVEWMVSQGKQIPRNPFFFLHEYKGEKSSGNDPLGQLLIAMVYAQQENTANIPVYGTYILGRFWFFVVLQDTKYAVSPAFDATKTEDLAGILANMQKVKDAIHKHLNI